MAVNLDGVPQVLSVRSAHPTLERIGVSTSYFPRYRNTRHGLHGVDAVLLSFVLGGRGRHVMEGEVFEERGGSVGITHYGQQHTIFTEGRGMEIMNVFLDPERHALPALPTALQGALSEFLPLHPALLHQLNRCVHLVFDDPRPVREALFRLHSELHEQPLGWEETALLHLRLVLVACCRQFLASGVVFAPRAGSTSAALERVRRHLDVHSGQPHTLADLAALAGMHPSALCRAFRAYTGRTPFAYLTARRLQAAMLALRSSDDKVLKVALDCGFQDLANFNRTFRRTVGATPTAYRRRFRSSIFPEPAESASLER